MNKRSVMFSAVVTVILVVGLAAQGGTKPAISGTLEQPTLPGIPVEQVVTEALEDGGTSGYLIYFDEQPDTGAAAALGWNERGRYVMEELQRAAEQSQRRTREILDEREIEYRAFWIDNVILVEASSKATLEALLGLEEIQAVKARRTMSLSIPERTNANQAAAGIEPNIAHLGAPEVWALGIDGRGTVIANIDTGVLYTHDALVEQYRGNSGSGSFDHNYNWFDPDGGTKAPTDGNGHGTHTMGVMVGDDGGANQIGMAPGAEWIACRACLTSTCSDYALLTCGQWAAAPTDLNGRNPNPDLRPHVVNNSWGDCEQRYDGWYQGVVDAWQAAGIYPVFSSGNASNCGYSKPPGLNTVTNPARYGNVTAVGSTGKADGQYASHSNWGPTDNPDSANPQAPEWAYLKPQVLAPGVSIRSAIKGSNAAYWNMTGTSMSAPHVSGLIALIWSAAPCFTGDYAQTETIIEQTANPIPYLSGGSPAPPPGNVPNYATGWGEIDAPAAVQQAAAECGPVGALQGSARDAGTDGPIAGARIEALRSISQSFTTYTGAGGSFLYYALPVGSYSLKASAPGYYSETISGVTVSEAVTETLTIRLDRGGISLSGQQELWGGKGETIHFSVEVTNTGTMTDSFKLATSEAGWTTSIVTPTVGPLPPGGAGTARVDMRLPVTPAVDFDTFTVTAVSETDGNVQAAAQMTARVILPGVEAGEPTDGWALPGEEIQFNITVQNTGNYPDSYTLNLSGGRWEAVLVDTAVSSLAPGGSAAVRVIITIPEGLTNILDDEWTLTAASQQDPSTVDAVILKAHVRRNYLPVLVK